MDIISVRMGYLSERSGVFVLKTTFVLCVLVQSMICLPVIPNSVQKSEVSVYSNSLPNSQSSPVVFGTRSLVQYSHGDRHSGQEQLAKQTGAQTLHMQPKSAKNVGSKATNESFVYAILNTVDSSKKPHSSSNINSIGKHSKNAGRGGTNNIAAQILTSTSQALQFKSRNSIRHLQESTFLKSDTHGENHDAENSLKTDNSKTIQLAVRSENTEGPGQPQIHETMLTVGTAVAALFSMGLIIGIFSCCCRKKPQAVDDKTEKNDREMTEKTERDDKLNVNEERSLADSKNPSQVFNSSDIPAGEKDLDDVISFKDKIKALDNKLIIQPNPEKRKSQLVPDQQNNRYSQHSPDVASKRRSQNEANMADSVVGLVKQPKILVSEDDDAQMKDRDTSRSLGDNISKSDTQDDISDKIFDNLSMHSSYSQPFNPDVVIADSDEEGDFAEIQRGTVILKSFQRAKPPRNRSPATRTSKGKIRKSRPNVNSPRNQDKQNERGEPASTPSSASVPFSLGTSDSKTNSLDKADAQKVKSKNNSLEKASERKKSTDKLAESPMTKSTDFSEFDSIMSKSITSIGSDIVTPMKRDNGKNGKFTKNKDRKESPARIIVSKEKEIIEKDKRSESPGRYKKNKDSPVEKRRGRRRENDRHSNRLSTDISEDKTVTNSSVENRLSGIPANASNNIFYLIDPTVKNKCKSVGDVTADKRVSGDYSKHAHKAMKHKTEDNQSEKNDEKGSPAKRERTYSDPNRKSGEIKTLTC